MKKKESKGYSEKIIKAYEENISKLPLKNKGHFFQRAYKITGSEKHAGIIAKYLLDSKPKKIKKALLMLKNKKNVEFIGKNNIKLSERKKRRNSLYKKNPEIKFYNNLLFDLFVLKKFSLDKSFLKKEFTAAVKILKKEKFRDIYLKREVIRFDSSFAINSIFILKYLDIIKIDAAAVDILRGMYLNKKGEWIKDMPNWEFMSLVYSLTHVIIADSIYYERHIRKYKWIIRFFSDNINEIIKRTTGDILAEVVLCFKLTRQENNFPKAYKIAIKHIIKNTDFKNMDNAEYLIKKEHTNSILMLIFSENKKLYKGPDLSSHQLFNKLIK